MSTFVSGGGVLRCSGQCRACTLCASGCCLLYIPTYLRTAMNAMSAWGSIAPHTIQPFYVSMNTYTCTYVWVCVVMGGCDGWVRVWVMCMCEEEGECMCALSLVYHCAPCVCSDPSSPLGSK